MSGGATLRMVGWGLVALTLAHAGLLLLALAVGAAWRGDVIVFTRAGEKVPPHLVLRDVGRSVEFALMTDDVYPSLPTWSPDGAWLAWLTQNLPQQWWLLRWEDLTVRPLAQGLPSGTMLAWSPDSQRVVFERLMTSGERRLMTVDVAGGTPQFLPNSLNGDQIAPAWSPDGRWLAYQVMDEAQVYHVALYDWATQQSSVIGIGGYPSWSPDGQRLAYLRYVPRHQRPQLAVYTFDDASTRVYPFDLAVDLRAPQWSPDGRFIAFRAEVDVVWLLDTTIHSGVRLAASYNILQFWPQWDPAGHALLVTQIGPPIYQRQIVLIDPITHAWRSLTPHTLTNHEMMATWMP